MTPLQIFGTPSPVTLKARDLLITHNVFFLAVYQQQSQAMKYTVAMMQPSDEHLPEGAYAFRLS